MNSDSLKLLLSVMDNETLTNLYDAGVNRREILTASNDQHWWYTRTQQLVGRGLLLRPNQDWRRQKWRLEQVSTSVV